MSIRTLPMDQFLHSIRQHDIELDSEYPDSHQLLFNSRLAQVFDFRRNQAGQLLSLLSIVPLQDDVWLHKRTPDWSRLSQLTGSINLETFSLLLNMIIPLSDNTAICFPPDRRQLCNAIAYHRLFAVLGYDDELFMLSASRPMVMIQFSSGEIVIHYRTQDALNRSQTVVSPFLP